MGEETLRLLRTAFRRNSHRAIFQPHEGGAFPGESADMTSAALKNGLGKDLPILFAHIGWAHYYDGTEPIHGNFSYLKDDPKHEMKNWEAKAFLKNDGVFSCGIGAGKVSSQRLPSASRSARNALLVPMCGPSLRL